GLALQLFLHPSVDDMGDRRVDADRLAECRRVGRVLREGLQSEVAELPRRVAFEQMRAPVDGVHRLARPGLAGVMAGEFVVLRLQARTEVPQGPVGKGGLSHAGCVSIPPRCGIPARRGGVATPTEVAGAEG